MESQPNDYDFRHNLKNDDKCRKGHYHWAIHVINQKSIDYLNTKISNPEFRVDSSVFRPNILVSGIEHDEEDTLIEMKLVKEDVIMRVTRLWVRCKTITYNQETGTHNENREPFATLMDYKTHPIIGTIFGIFVQPDKEFTIKGKLLINNILVGDHIKYTKRWVIPLETV